jgi:hypothetical protein
MTPPYRAKSSAGCRDGLKSVGCHSCSGSSSCGMSVSVSRLRDELPSCRGTATSSETALAEMIVIFRQTGLLEQCQWHMYGLGVLVQVPLNFPERRIWIVNWIAGVKGCSHQEWPRWQRGRFSIDIPRRSVRVCSRSSKGRLRGRPARDDATFLFDFGAMGPWITRSCSSLG